MPNKGAAPATAAAPGTFKVLLIISKSFLRSTGRFRRQSVNLIRYHLAFIAGIPIFGIFQCAFANVLVFL